MVEPKEDFPQLFRSFLTGLFTTLTECGDEACLHFAGHLRFPPTTESAEKGVQTKGNGELFGASKKPGSARPRNVPTLEQVRVYWIVAGLKGNPDEYFDHFEEVAWKRRGLAVKDWKAGARNWSRRSPQFDRGSKAADMRHEAEIGKGYVETPWTTPEEDDEMWRRLRLENPGVPDIELRSQFVRWKESLRP